MKKSLAMLMTLLFVLLGTTAWAQSYTAGVYTAQANGNNGPVTVEVEVSDAEILSVKVTEHAETAGLSDTPIERIPAKIVEGQTLAVDTVSGATNTSNAILKAAEDALAQAGADIEALKAVQEKDETAGETAERHVQALVIGAGGSGLAAAITLQEQGIETLVVDKMANAGGATALTGALINGGCSKQQAERGVTDDVQTMFMDAMVYGSFQNDARMTWLMVNNTGDSVDWLHDTVGVEFEEAINHFPEHTNDRAFYPKGKLPGYLTGTMEQHYLSNGGELLLETRAQHLLTEDGRVIGASCSTADGTLNIYADVTLLATGGYGASVALRPADQMGTLFYGASASTGDGIIMAEEVGAMTHYMQYLKSYPQGIEKPLDGGNITADGTTFRGNAYISPLASQAVTLNDGAIYVNVEGERCMNENMDFVSIKKVTQKQTDMTVYLVMDQKGYDNWMGMMEVSAGLTPEIVAPWLDADDGKPVFRKGATVEEAAAKAGIDAEKLSATVAHFNEMVASGKDDDFGRAEMSVGLDSDGPIYIVEQRLRMATSLGGLKTSTSFEVYDENEQAIDGLYACGEVIGGVHGDESMPSNCVAWAVTSGRLAAKAAADAVKAK
ncbi:MAG: FAD-dependent oxidoreductase [Christensenellales bacterium]|nr:FAD-dependent oxidoreductase [Christensenellales bacterium]